MVLEFVLVWVLLLLLLQLYVLSLLRGAGVWSLCGLRHASPLPLPSPRVAFRSFEVSRQKC